MAKTDGPPSDRGCGNDAGANQRHTVLYWVHSCSLALTPASCSPSSASSQSLSLVLSLQIVFCSPTMVLAPIASGEIDKPNLRTPHIVLHTVPSLSFSTPTHTVNFQLSLLSPPQDKFQRMATVVDAQSAVSYGSDRASLSSSIARAQSRQSSVAAVDERSEELSQRQQGETASTHTFGKMEEYLEQRVDRLEKRMKEQFEGQSWLMDKLKSDMDKRFDAQDKRFDAQDKRIDKLKSDMDKRFDAQDERMDRMEANIEGIKKSLETLATYMMDPDRGTSIPIESTPRQTALTRMPATVSQASLVTRTSGKRSLKNTKFYRNLSGFFSGLRAQIDQVETSAAQAAEELEIRVEEPVVGPSPYLVADAQSRGVSTEQLAASPSSQVSEAQRLLINQPILPDWR
ncbi:hypothetical protein C8Q78DRAFT_1064875 [Trametes maxima]|nr:hypothetical protein C8Q78DRAFT_1064875 [Trametes maxima]